MINISSVINVYYFANDIFYVVKIIIFQFNDISLF